MIGYRQKYQWNEKHHIIEMVPKSLSGVGIGNLIKKNKQTNKQTNKQKTNFSPVWNDMVDWWILKSVVKCKFK